MKKYKILFLALFSVCLADTKIGYIDSQVIMNEYEDVRQVQVELEKEQKRLETIYKKNIASYDSLSQALQTGSIILSKEKLSQMENDLLQKQREIEEFQLKYFGPQGELYKMQENLLKPILAVIDEAIQNIGKEKGYDYIFDAVQGSIVYALESNNLTADVLEELKKININKEKNN
tara:strand:- start:65 stop:592 length:528 start_codon:yes stop_codon:yes gene_type:complete